MGPKLATSILFVPPRHLQMVRTGLHAEELLAVSRGGSGDAARTPAEQWSAVEQQKALTKGQENTAVEGKWAWKTHQTAI